MQRWIWPLIIVAALLAAFAVDHLIWPNSVVVWMYTIPILIASAHWRPRGVLAVIIVASFLALDDLYASGRATTQGVLGFVLLGAVGILALINTLHREEMCRRLQRQQAAIDTVQQLRQPLTVILGNIQLLEIAPPSETTLERALAAMHRAGVDLQNQLTEILTKGGID